uniref:Uncharacterized protein n=2 Tax=Canis lupus familiaris TaxID=9615 RepID=A0A8C0Z1Z3_CANLF
MGPSLGLLLLVPRVVPPLEPLELRQRVGRRLVEQQRHGLRLLGLGHEHRVAAQHHRLVLELVPVHPGEHLGQPRVRHAVGDAVQQVQVARAARRALLGVSRCLAAPSPPPRTSGQEPSPPR